MKVYAIALAIILLPAAAHAQTKDVSISQQTGPQNNRTTTIKSPVDTLVCKRPEVSHCHIFCNNAQKAAIIDVTSAAKADIILNGDVLTINYIADNTPGSIVVNTNFALCVFGNMGK